MLSQQIENAQKKVEEQNFLIRKRVLEYDDVMNQQREVIYEYRDRDPRGRGHVGDRARRRSPRRSSGSCDEYLAGDYRRGMGPRRPVHPARADLPDRASRPRTSTRARSTRTSWSTELREDVVEAYERARGGARRRADARSSSATCCSRSSTSAGASTCTTWTTCARASTCAGSPRSTRWSAYKNEGFEMFRELMNSDLGGVRALHLPRRGRDRGRAAARQSSATGPLAWAAARPATRAAYYAGGTAADQPSALAAAAAAGSAGAAGMARGRAARSDRAAARGRDAPRGRARADRPQRPVLVRLGQEVQEVPRG